MIEIILKLSIALTALVIIQAFYNTFLYRQPKNVRSISMVAVPSFIVFIVVISLWLFTNKLRDIPHVGNVVKSMDSPFSAFVNYIPKSHRIFWLSWFLIPIFIVWVVFIFKGGIVYQKIKRDYFKFIDKQKSKDDVQIQKESSSNNADVISTSTNIKKAVVNKNNNLENEKPKNGNNVISFKHTAPPKKYFLEGVRTYPFDHKTLKGIAKVLPEAKADMILGKTFEGYVAVYESSKGYKQLKQLFSENSIDISTLQAKPSIVFFTQETVKSKGLKEYVNQLKEVRKT